MASGGDARRTPAGVRVPGEYRLLEGEPAIELLPGRARVTIDVTNVGDRPVQVGSHYAFAETNAGLEFDRAAATGMRLDIPPGTAVRFEPGERRPVALVAIGGAGLVLGHRGTAEAAAAATEAGEADRS